MLQQLRPAIVSVLVFTVLTGLIFPGIVTVLGKALFAHQANGSLIDKNGKPTNDPTQAVGSVLIGQNFAASGYFHLRPSAAGNGYDPTSSGGTNLGPTSDKLINGIHKKTTDGKDDPGNFDGIKDLAAAYRKENNLPDTQDIPADAATRSASGLDPDISPANASLQAGRVAAQRGLSQDAVQKLIDDNTAGRTFGILGEPRVNVLKLNMALDGAAPGKSGVTPPAK